MMWIDCVFVCLFDLSCDCGWVVVLVWVFCDFALRCLMVLVGLYISSFACLFLIGLGLVIDWWLLLLFCCDGYSCFMFRVLLVVVWRLVARLYFKVRLRLVVWVCWLVAGSLLFGVTLLYCCLITSRFAGGLVIIDVG